MRSIVMGAALLALAIPAASHAAPAKAKAKPPARVEAVDSKKAPDLDILAELVQHVSLGNRHLAALTCVAVA